MVTTVSLFPNTGGSHTKSMHLARSGVVCIHKCDSMIVCRCTHTHADRWMWADELCTCTHMHLLYTLKTVVYTANSVASLATPGYLPLILALYIPLSVFSFFAQRDFYSELVPHTSGAFIAIRVTLDTFQCRQGKSLSVAHQGKGHTNYTQNTPICGITQTAWGSGTREARNDTFKALHGHWGVSWCRSVWLIHNYWCNYWSRAVISEAIIANGEAVVMSVHVVAAPAYIYVHIRMAQYNCNV